MADLPKSCEWGSTRACSVHDMLGTARLWEVALRAGAPATKIIRGSRRKPFSTRLCPERGGNQFLHRQKPRLITAQ